MSDVWTRNRAWIALLTAVFISSACVPALQEHRDSEVEQVIPQGFADQGSDEPSTARTDWRAFFEDPNLQRLIEEALANNQELHILQQEIRIAASEVSARSGEVLPQAGVGVDAGAGKPGSYPLERHGPRAAFEGDGRVGTEYGIGVYATWEVDVWNKLRSATKAACISDKREA